MLQGSFHFSWVHTEASAVAACLVCADTCKCTSPVLAVLKLAPSDMCHQLSSGKMMPAESLFCGHLWEATRLDVTSKPSMLQPAQNPCWFLTTVASLCLQGTASEF